MGLWVEVLEKDLVAALVLGQEWVEGQEWDLVASLVLQLSRKRIHRTRMTCRQFHSVGPRCSPLRNQLHTRFHIGLRVVELEQGLVTKS